MTPPIATTPPPQTEHSRPERITLVEQWAELLWALKQGSPSISTSAEQMAEDLPHELVDPVNRQLQDNGWDFQVRPHRSAAAGRFSPSAAPRPAYGSDRAARAASPHRCG